jgi:hypothetical protein
MVGHNSLIFTIHLRLKKIKEYQHVKAKLDTYFEPKINITFETYNFRQLAQNESIDKFVTRLPESASRCQFHDTAQEIKDQVVQKCT